MRKSDLEAWLCNECQYKGIKSVILLPPEMKDREVKFCPFERHIIKSGP